MSDKLRVCDKCGKSDSLGYVTPGNKHYCGGVWRAAAVVEPTRETPDVDALRRFYDREAATLLPFEAHQRNVVALCNEITALRSALADARRDADWTTKQYDALRHDLMRHNQAVPSPYRFNVPAAARSAAIPPAAATEDTKHG